MSSTESEDRAEFIAEIRNAPSFLDAVFQLYHCKMQGYPKFIPDVTPEEVFGACDADLYADCLTRSIALRSWSGSIGSAAYNYPGAAPYEDVLKNMKEKNPGFSEQSYGTVCHLGFFAMR